MIHKNIKVTGRLGINSTRAAPGYQLDVNGNVNIDGGMITMDAGQAIGFGTAGADFIMKCESSPKDLTFSVATSEKMRIETGGNVGIGTNDPSSTLHVVGTGYITGNTTIGGNAEVTGYVKTDDYINNDGVIVNGEVYELEDDAQTEITNDLGTNQILEVWVNNTGYDEYGLYLIYGNGTVTLLASNGSVSNSDSDVNLCVYNSTGTVYLKNRLGATLTIKTILKQ